MDEGARFRAVSGSTVKKIIVDRYDRERLRGYAQPQTCYQPDGFELLSQDGSAGLVPYGQIKAVSFVRDLEGEGVLEGRLEFLARPKTVGVWVEMLFRDGTRMEGVLPGNLLLVEPMGYTFTPPDAASNAQRVFVPRQALQEVSVLGVIGGRRRKFEKAEPQQFSLFGAS